MELAGLVHAAIERLTLGTGPHEPYLFLLLSACTDRPPEQEPEQEAVGRFRAVRL